MRPGSEIPPVAVAALAMVGYGEDVQDVEVDAVCDIRRKGVKARAKDYMCSVRSCRLGFS
jgi:hypothetical protein